MSAPGSLQDGAGGTGAAAASALAGLDPGRSKCGLVLTDPGRREIRTALVLPPEQAWQRIEAWRRSDGLAAVVLGDGTGSAHWRQRLEPQLSVLLVDETGTTLAARQRYWQLQRGRSWRRLLPAGLRLPPRDIDDVVAQLLIERHLGRTLPRRGGGAELG